jgi:hypothetical protein
MQFGMKTNKQKKDSMLFIIIGYTGAIGLIIGLVIGRLL